MLYAPAMAGHARVEKPMKPEHEEHEPRGGNAVVAQLTRIADALERAYPPAILIPTVEFVPEPTP